ncbi:MAG: protein translocase subunit SecF [Candidatus Colwellbacteria bacterium]|nr:protein translocase subunit SecF [Candidatus Colwellbacteria bacterium]
MINVIGRRKIFFVFSGLTILLSLLSIILFSFHLGIDFKGGSLWQLRIPEKSEADVRNFFASELGVSDMSVGRDPASSIYSLEFKEIKQAERTSYFNTIKGKFSDKVEDLDFWALSPSVSSELRDRAILAIVLVMVGISFYIAFAFRKVSRPISSWKYGVITLLTLFHDVVIPAGVFAALGKVLGVPADINFVVALLFVMGFSVHDTIVVFDRIRENLLTLRGRDSLENIVNVSVNQILGRSINTSLTLILVLVALYFLGPLSLKYFILTILIGTVTGAYSSIFIASPLLVVAQGKKG